MDDGTYIVAIQKKRLGAWVPPEGTECQKCVWGGQSTQQATTREHSRSVVVWWRSSSVDSVSGSELRRC